MALRRGGAALARGLAAARGLPTRGGGGGPVKFAPAPDRPIPVWDELWWDDGLLHSQPVLDGTITQQLQSPASTAKQLMLALSGLVGSIMLMNACWSERKDIVVPQQYPPETLAMYEGKRVEWARPPLREAPPS